MLLGIVIGTFSSFYISAPVLIWLNVTPDSFVQPESGRPGAERVRETFPDQR
jgi:preprotein translocase subunit SecF